MPSVQLRINTGKPDNVADEPQGDNHLTWLLYGLAGTISARVLAVFNPVAWFLRKRWRPVTGAPEFVALFKRDGRSENFDLLKWVALLECGAPGACLTF